MHFSLSFYPPGRIGSTCEPDIFLQRRNRTCQVAQNQLHGRNVFHVTHRNRPQVKRSRAAGRRLPNACGSTPKGRLSIRSTCWCRTRARRSSVIENRMPNAIGGMTRVALNRHPRRSFQPVTMAPTLSIITDDTYTLPILGEVQHSRFRSAKTTNNRTGECRSAVSRHLLRDIGVKI
jgi:hypothetical protein